MENNKFVNAQIKPLSRGGEAIEMTSVIIALLLVCLGLPLLVKAMPNNFISANNQLIMGSVVNCVLITIGMNFKGWTKTFGPVLLPSLIHVLLFCFFAIGTIYNLYVLPALWLGNLAIVFSFKYFYAHKQWNFALVSAIGIAIKCAVVFGGFLILLVTNTVPQGMPEASNMIVSMGINQLVVGAIGCVTAFIVLKLAYAKNANLQMTVQKQ